MQELAPKAWQYGVLGIVALAFAWAVVMLWKASRTDAVERTNERTAMEKERGEWAQRELGWRAELARKESEIRAEYEHKHREVIDHYAQLARREREEHLRNLDRAREEFSEIMEKVSADASKSADALVNVLQKFFERFVGPGRGRY